MTGSKFRLGYIPELDGIRGLAILTVLFYHMGELCRIQGFVEGGHIGVDIFFVLSGFLITTILIQEFDSKGGVSFRNFYFRRVLRLGPALLGLLIILALFCYIFMDSFWAKYNFVDTFITLFYMSNWARAFRIHSPSFLGHTWSLSIEEQFYMLWPMILVLLLKHVKNRWSVAYYALMISLSAMALRVYLTYAGSSMERLYNGLDTRIDSLMIGCTLGIIVSSKLITDTVSRSLSRVIRFSSPVCLAIIISIALTMSWKSYHLYYWGFSLIAVLTSVLIFDLVTNSDSFIKPVFSMKWLVWTGQVSYGLYLWHYPIYKSLMLLNFGRFEIIVFGTAAAFAITAVSFYLLEKPLLKFKKAVGSD